MSFSKHTRSEEFPVSEPKRLRVLHTPREALASKEFPNGARVEFVFDGDSEEFNINPQSQNINQSCIDSGSETSSVCGEVPESCATGFENCPDHAGLMRSHRGVILLNGYCQANMECIECGRVYRGGCLQPPLHYGIVTIRRNGVATGNGPNNTWEWVVVTVMFEKWCWYLLLDADTYGTDEEFDENTELLVFQSKERLLEYLNNDSEDEHALFPLCLDGLEGYTEGTIKLLDLAKMDELDLFIKSEDGPLVKLDLCDPTKLPSSDRYYMKQRQ